MSELREKMIKAMELRNFSPRTQTAYLSAVTNLASHYMKSPQEILQVEVEDYLLSLKKERKTIIQHPQPGHIWFEILL